MTTSQVRPWLKGIWRLSEEKGERQELRLRRRGDEWFNETINKKLYSSKYIPRHMWAHSLLVLLREEESEEVKIVATLLARLLVHGGDWVKQPNCTNRATGLERLILIDSAHTLYL
jgi:hypothetical protein